ncbi:MAG: ATP-binding cassette domain-containing protein [Oscillospiraceae bacterium]
MTLLTTKGLEKSYPGMKALDGVDIQLEAGKITGLLGPNTSGKTTLLKTMAGLLQPDRGEVQYPGGAKPGPEAKQTVSLLPDTMLFPAWMRVRDAFAYYKSVYPDYKEARAADMNRLLELKADMHIRKMSKGMQERVALGLTFSRETSVYLLDEPLGGIDPFGKMKVLESILSMPLEQSCILLSTHLVKDVETIFDNVLFISAGKIIYRGDAEQIREEQGKTVEQVYLEVFSNVATM